MSKRLGTVVIAAFLAVGSFGLGVTLAPNEKDEPKPKKETLTFKVDGPDADRKADDIVRAGGDARKVLDQAQKTPGTFDLGDNLRGDDPTKEGAVSGPLAAPEWPGCKTRFTPVNFSSRTASIRGFALHYTGGGNRPGWADMNGLAAYSASRAAGVSWHFLVDREGHCYYMVPTSKKAWTIGNLNSQTINVETIGNGKEASYGGTAGFRKVAAIVRRAASIYHFPVRLGAVSGCSITRPGVITHWMGGACAGGHIDIRPYDIARVVAQMGGKPVTATDRATCRKLNYWRSHGRAHGQPEANAVRRKAALTKRHVRCTSHGPIRT
jgi:hypothetical protein